MTSGLTISEARNVLLQTLSLCEDIKTIVTADTIDNLDQRWRDKLEQLGQVIFTDRDKTTGVKTKQQGESGLWEVIHALIHCLKRLEVAADAIEGFEQFEDSKDGGGIEVLSIQQQVQTQVCFNLVLGYAIRCLIPFPINLPGYTTNLKTAAVQVYSHEYAQLNETDVTERFAEIVSLIQGFLSSRVTIFKQIPIRSHYLIQILIYFLYDSEPRRILTPLDFQLVQYLTRDLFFRLSRAQGFQVLMYQFYNSNCPPMKVSAVRAFRDFLTVPGNLVRLVETTVSESSWTADVLVIPHFVATVLQEPNTDQLFTMLCTQTSGIISSKGTNPAVLRVAVGILTAVTNSKRHRAFTDYIWSTVLSPLSTFVDINSDPVPRSLQEVIDCVELYHALIDVSLTTKRSPGGSPFFKFHPTWYSLVTLYTVVAAYLERAVIENEDFLTSVKNALADVIVKVVFAFAELIPETLKETGIKKKKKLAEFVITLLVRSGSTSTNPVTAVLVPDDTGNLNCFQRDDTEVDVLQKLAVRSVQFFRLLSSKLNQTLLTLLFAQLIQFEDPSFRKILIPKSIDEIRFKEEQPAGIDFKDFESIRNFVATLILGEFGSDESDFEQFFTGIESDSETAFSFLTFMVSRFEAELKEWAEATRAQNNPALGGHPSIVPVLEMIETLCEATYDEETGLNPKAHKPSDPDEALKQALIGWKKLETFKPFLKTLIGFEHEALIQSGISGKCEELLMTIETRRRSRGTREKKSGSTWSLNEILYSIQASDPSKISAGLVHLKKMIFERDSNVKESFEVIFNNLVMVLDNEDQFVYNHCINTLVALTIEYHQTLVVKLLTQFLRPVPTKLMKFTGDTVDITGNPEGCRLKIGEVLCKTFTSVGAISGQYLNYVLNVTQKTALDKDSSTLVKISAYQVLSALVQNLTDLETCIGEIWPLAETGLNQLHQEGTVRVAIWNLIETLFRIMSENSGVVLGPLCSNFARDATIKAKIDSVGEDDRERQARQGAVQESDKFAKTILQRNCDLVTKIQIL